MTQQNLLAGNMLFTCFNDGYLSEVATTIIDVIGRIRSSVYFEKLQPICLLLTSQL